MYQQREPVPDNAPTERSWDPGLHPDPAPFVNEERWLMSQSEPDWYVVVDELEDGRCRLTIDRWPGVDRLGRLQFSTAPTRTVVVDESAFYERCRAERREQHQAEAPDRPLRIGDTFAIWAAVEEAPEHALDLPVAWLEATDMFPGRLIDVTGAARDLAHAAAEAAAAGVLDTEDAVTLGVIDPEELGERRPR